MIYEVISSDNQYGLAAQVNTMLSQGWQLQGGVSVAGYFTHWENERKGHSERETVHIFAQAMVKPDADGGDGS